MSGDTEWIAEEREHERAMPADRRRRRRRGTVKPVRMRKKCLRLGHDFRELEEVRMPVQFCRRWFCGASRVSEWVWVTHPASAAALDSERLRREGMS